MGFPFWSSDQRRGSRQTRRALNPLSPAALVERLEQKALLSLTPIPATVNFTAGKEPSNAVTIGSFLDSDTTAVAGNFTAAITWGDGNTSAGTVSLETGTPGRFDIAGNNLYITPNTYSISILVKDYQGDSTTVSSTAFVSGPVLTPFPTTISPPVGQPFTGTVASFFDSNAADTASNLSATITWGNGNVTTGTVSQVQGSPQHFAVQGTNTYTSSGTFPVSVVMVNTQGQTATASSSAIVAVPTIMATGTAFPAIPGVALPGNTIVANFIDSNTNATATNLAAVINWGDGQTTAGTVNATNSPGNFTVTGSHTYATTGTSGSFTVGVTIVDPGGQTASVKSTAFVATPIAAAGTTFSTSPGVPLPANTVVANFIDINPNASAQTITAVINWGDGQTSTGTVNSTGTSNVYTVTGGHIYAVPGAKGAYTVTISIADPSGQTATATSSALVAGFINATGTSFIGTVGQPLMGVTVANFTDTNPNATAQNIAAVINWGDGQSTSGVVTSIAGVYAVTGNHKYSTAGTNGSFPVTVTIIDPSGQTANATSTALVAAPAIVAAGTTFPATSGVALPSNTVVANFTDSNTNATAQTIAAVIHWGDGQTSVGAVNGPTFGVYTVTGSHTYANGANGTLPVNVTIVDPSGQTAVANSTALVVAPVLSPIPVTVSFTVGVPPSGPVTVGSFFDSNTGVPLNHFTATINWGAGQQTLPGTITGPTTSPGLFSVTGTYLYPAAGTYSVTIQVQDGQGNSTTIFSTAVVVTNIVTTPANFGFSGGLAANSNNGPYASEGYTTTNRPTFGGTAIPFSTVQLFGKFKGVDAEQPLGEAVTNASGQWILPVGPLAPGTYSITATVTPPGSYPTSATLGSTGIFYIDMAPKKGKAARQQAIKANSLERATLKRQALEERKVANTHAAKHRGR